MKTLNVAEIILCLVFFCISSAQIPRNISYQAVLTDASGNAVPDGEYNLTFRLYEVESGGSSLWTEVQTVDVANGIMNVSLGVTEPLDLEFQKTYWLGVTISDNPELKPRMQLTSSPYSLMANNVMDTCITAEKIADGSVTIAKILPDVVSSLNSVVNDGGNIDLVAGSNITIIPNNIDKTITISSSGGGGVSGSGTTNYLPMFTGPTTLGNSAAYQSGSNIGFGTINPQGLVHITRYGDKQLILGHDNQPSWEWLFEVDAAAKMTLKNEGAGSPLTVMSFNPGNGNIGIGKDNPAEKLDVNGIIRSSAGGFKFPDGTIQTTAVLEPEEIYFSVKRDGVYDWPINGTVQSVDFVNNSTVWANVGGGFDTSTGVFFAPISGIYTFHGVVYFRGLDIGNLIYAQILVGSKYYLGEYKNASGDSETVTISITTYLNSGEFAALRGYVSASSPPAQVYGNTSDSYTFTYFSGALVN